MPEVWIFVIGLAVTTLTLVACFRIGKSEAAGIDEYDESAEPFSRRRDDGESGSVVPMRRDRS